MKMLMVSGLGYETIHGINDEIVDLAGKGIMEPEKAQEILRKIRIKGFELSQILRDEVSIGPDDAA